MSYFTTRTNSQRLRRIAHALTAIAMGFVVISPAVAAEKESEMVLKKEPKGAVDILALKKDVKDQQDVVVVGRIGGRVNPWVKGTAVFPIVDRSLKPCDEIPGDMCKTPWDYCCETNVPKATLLVMFVDETGKVIKHDPREMFNVKELSTVVVQGKAKRDKAGNVTVLASKIHVREDKQATDKQ
jgi:hypothetical protein